MDIFQFVNSNGRIGPSPILPFGGGQSELFSSVVVFDVGQGHRVETSGNWIEV